MAVTVYRRSGEDFESLYKRFKQAVRLAGIDGDASKHEFALSTGEKKRKKISENAKRRRRNEHRRAGREGAQATAGRDATK